MELQEELFSNESGMGSAPTAAAAAQAQDNPVRQALVSSTGTFLGYRWWYVCMTGLVLVAGIMKDPSIHMGNITDGGVSYHTGFWAGIPGSWSCDPCSGYHFLRQIRQSLDMGIMA